MAGDSSDILIRFDNVTRRFGQTVAVDGLTLDIRNNEFFALLGPSGCGKTTLLRMLAGFEMPDVGRVLLGGADITALPPHRRPVNMMFQSYALFPHLSVEGNIAFGLKQEGLPKDQIASRVAEMLALTRLDGLGGRRPDQLSGGQRQRVALARSLVKRPRVLLLDEPLGALDKKLRAETQFELMALQRKLGTTFVIVTHDQDEAMILADRIAVMNRGTVAQVGPPADIYEHPASRWVAEFVGDVSLLEGRVNAGGAVETASGTFGGAGAAKVGDKVWLALRPEKIRMASARPADGNAVAATILDAGYLGDVTLYQARLADGTVMKVSTPNTERAGGAFKSGEAVWLSWPAAAAVLLRE
ncbi:MAG: ABC transporter ATP-binding protein [Xanthobacteraceae bacterium]|uniref:ABC transporter ATP-binding protein n=1 Tax=Pseudolabrys sp. TaxID=1960880 RepID=UPI003D09D0C6